MADRVLRVIFAGDAKQLQGVTRQVESGLARTGTKLASIGGKMTRGLTLPLVAAGAAAAKTAIDFESAFTGVTKTVEGTDAQLSSIREGIRDMAKEIPATTTEIAAIAEAAGALGIETDSVLGFTRTMIDLGETTDLTADQAATSLARIANVMGTAQSDFDRFGSAIVDLGNNGESTESEITAMATRIAAAGKIAGMAESDILGISAALANVGVKAESGGTAAQKVLNGLSEAVATSNDDLQVFADTAGMTAEKFKEAWEKDAAGAFASFVAGLGEAGDGAFEILRQLGLDNERTITAFLSLAASGDNLTESLKTGQKAWKENTALATEAEKRYATTASGMEILRNNVADLAISMSDTLLPAVQGLVKGVSGAVKWFSNLGDGTKKVILGFVGIAAAAGPVLSITGKLITAYTKLQGLFKAQVVIEGYLAMNKLQIAAGMAAANIGKIVTLLKGGIIVTTITGLAMGLDKLSDKLEEVTNAGAEDWFAGLPEGRRDVEWLKSNLDAIKNGTEAVVPPVKMLSKEYKDGFHAAGKSAHQAEVAIKAVGVRAAITAKNFANMEEADLDEWKEGVRNNIGVVSGAFERIGNKAKLTSEKIINIFRKQIEAARDFGNNLKTLANQGMSEFTAKTIASMGPAGAAIAEALVEGPRKDIREFDNLLAQGTAIEANFANQTMSHFGFAASGIDKVTAAAQRVTSALHNIPTNITTTHTLVTKGTVAPGTVRAGRAHGGNVAGGQSYLVGERGPEVITMGRSGKVTPNHALQRGGDTIIHIHTDGTQDGRKVAQVVRDELEKDRRRNARHDRTRGAA